jgi:hypothetical protein
MTVETNLRSDADEIPATSLPATWVENYQWLAMDDDRTGIVCHIGTHAQDPSLWHVVFGLSFASGEVLVHKSVGRAPDARSPGTSEVWTRCDKASKRWTLDAYTGVQSTTFAELGDGLLRDRETIPCRATITLDAFGPIWEPGKVPGHPEMGHFHYEQPLRVTGDIELRGQRHQFDGYGYRDHSRGPRDMSQVSHSTWCNGVFPSGRTFCSVTVTRTSGDVMSLGAILDRSGTIEDARLGKIPELHDAAHNPIAFDLTLEDSSGATHEIFGEVAGGATWSMIGGSECCLGTAVDDPEAYILPQSIIRWRWNDEVGYGLADRCSRSDRLMQITSSIRSAGSQRPSSR